jgi:hypothetical protein
MIKTVTQLLEQYKEKDFSWGTMDCCVFVGELSEQISGQTLHKANWKKFVTYTSFEESKETVKEFGGKKIKDLPSIVLGTPMKDISKVKHSDIVYMEDEEGIGGLGICNGVRAYFLAKPKGLMAVNVEDCLACWSIAND